MDEDGRFIEQCAQANNYPGSLLDDRDRSRSTQYKTRFDNHQQTMFHEGGSPFVYVPIRDFNDGLTGEKPTARNIKNVEELKQYIGENDFKAESLKKDPRFRFILLETQYTGCQVLNLTRDMLMLILTYHQVSSCYLNFITFFGSKTGACDLSFGGFQAESTLLRPGHTSARLRRSGRRIKISYTLGAVEDNRKEAPTIPNVPNSTGDKEGAGQHWIRPVASIHHQFDPVEGTSLWIITAPLTTPAKPAGKSKGKIWTPEFRRFITEKHQRDQFASTASCFAASLDVHLRLAAWSVAEFPYCLESVDASIRNLTDQYIDLKTPMVEETDLQKLYKLIDETNDYILCLESNQAVMRSLAAFYRLQFIRPPLIPRSAQTSTAWQDECEEETHRFLDSLDGRIHEMHNMTHRAKVLVTLARSREGVSQTNSRMMDLTRQNHEETVTVGLFQRIALVYLPVTVTSAVWSTDILKFQPDLQPGQSISFSAKALYSWLIATVGLTTLTMLLSEFWKSRKRLELAGQDNSIQREAAGHTSEYDSERPNGNATPHLASPAMGPAFRQPHDV
ncbi:hypothetical protein F4778DRAFT_776432 [Xylariomycetidae sp. FL2044]|nr:hypothetical protein F4778DRAFT_776432 [Xylariomycetidae sp. FL2044]